MPFMVAAAPYLLAASAAVAAVGAVQQGRAAKAAGKYNAAMNMQNATLARQEAASLAERQTRENYLRRGAIRAAQGHAGGSGSEGSVLDVLGDVVSQGELQRQYILRSGEIRANAYENSATLDNMGGKAAQTAGYLRAGGALLSAAGSSSSGGRTLPTQTANTYP